MAVTLLAFFAACQIMGVAVTWYMVVAAVVLGVILAFFGGELLLMCLKTVLGGHQKEAKTPPE